MDEKEFDYINMIPFIDVMLVLLTIVLTTSTFVVTGIIPVELPRVAGRHEAVTTTQVVVIDREGTLFFQGEAISPGDLRVRISPVPKETPFLVRADKDVHLQGFVEALDIIKTSGFKKVSLQTEWMGQ